jgi:hypothetical protein
MIQRSRERRMEMRGAPHAGPPRGGAMRAPPPPRPRR